LKKIAKSKVNYEPWETPLALQRHISNEHPEIAPAFAAVVNAYLNARYSAGPTDLEPLRKAIAQLP
jgi:hypothetical protein